MTKQENLLNLNIGDRAEFVSDPEILNENGISSDCVGHIVTIHNIYPGKDKYAALCMCGSRWIVRPNQLVPLNIKNWKAFLEEKK